MNNLSSQLPVEPKLSKAKILYLTKKIVALTLIFNALYVLAASVKDIFVIQNQLKFFNQATASALQQSLFKKAFIISSSLFIDTLYGFSLLVKPANTTKIIHIILGILIFILSKFILNLTAVDQILKDFSLLFLSFNFVI